MDGTPPDLKAPGTTEAPESEPPLSTAALIDHIRHWANGGETKLANLVSLCRYHHRQVHEGGITVERLDDGAWRFTRTIGPHVDTFDSVARGASAPLGDWRALVAAHAEQGIRIDPSTAATRWLGETLDYGQAMMVLVQRAERAGTFRGNVLLSCSQRMRRFRRNVTRGATFPAEN